MSLGFIGGGNMARALIAGLIRRGTPPGTIAVGEPFEASRQALSATYGVHAEADNLAVARRADTLVLAVKPQELRAVLQALGPAFAERIPLLVSVAAGIRLGDLERWVPAAHIVRAMPNRPALYGAGAAGLYANAAVSAAERQQADSILGAVGSTVWVRSEAELDVVTALSGSGPAYFLLLAEHLAAAGTALGLEAATARQLAAQTLYGTGQIAHEEPDLAAQRQAVTSKGGTTEAALRALTAANLAGIMERAVRAAAERSAEMARQFGDSGATE